MNFLKNIASSTIGSIIGLLIAGTILIFIFVGILISGIFGAISELEDAESEIYSGDANVIEMNLNSKIVERGGEMPFDLNFTGLTPDPQIGLIFQLMSMGSLLSILMISFGIMLFFKSKKNES